MSAEAEAVKSLMKELQEQSANQMEALMQKFMENSEKTNSLMKEANKDKDKTHKEVFDDKFAKGFKTFDGKQENWKHWILKFKNRIKMKSKDVHDLLLSLEILEHPMDDMTNYMQFEKVSSELYDVLCDLMEGTALIQIQNVDGENCLEAYRKIFRFYNPVTPAKLLKKLVEIVKPPKIEKMEDSIMMLEQWKLKLSEATRDFGEEMKLSNSMQIAIATSMMMPDIQETIYPHAETIKNFKAFEEKITTLISNKVDMGPVPMDIGKIEADWYRYHQEHSCQMTNQGEGDMVETELGWVTVGSGMCFNCGGFGHLKVNCPSPLKTNDGKGNGKAGMARADLVRAVTERVTEKVVVMIRVRAVVKAAARG